MAQMITFWENAFFVNLNWLFPRRYQLFMLPQKPVKMHTILKSNETFDLHKILKHSKFTGQISAQAKEITKKCKFCKNSQHRGKCLAYGKVCHNCYRKNHFKTCCQRDRKTFETELPFADEYEFFLDTINLYRSPENLVKISQIKNQPSTCFIL